MLKEMVIMFMGVQCYSYNKNLILLNLHPAGF